MSKTIGNTVDIVNLKRVGNLILLHTGLKPLEKDNVSNATAFMLWPSFNAFGTISDTFKQIIEGLGGTFYEVANVLGIPIYTAVDYTVKCCDGCEDIRLELLNNIKTITDKELV